jgi:3-isopropylmalate dehydrogenase
MKIAILPGDGIGTEIVAEAVKVLHVLDLKFESETALVGGAAYDAHGHPLPESTLKLAMASDAVLFGAVGDWKYDTLDRPLRPEQAILGLRKNMGLFANFRPAICYEQLGRRIEFETCAHLWFGYFDHSRTHGRYLLRPTPRSPCRNRRSLPRR